MKKVMSICLLVVALFLLSSTVFATNWVYYDRSTIVAGNLYIDADSVIKNGDNLTYWELLTYDKPIGVTAKLITKYEVKLAPSRKYRIADTHYYLADNSDDKVTNEWNNADTTTGKWVDSFAGTDINAETNFAFKYAKEGQDTVQIPTPEGSDVGEITTPQNGKGVYVWANGDRYEGEWKDGKENGKGVFTWANGARYEGDFVDGKKTGKGVITWADGSRYEGDWVDGSRTGKGILTWGSNTQWAGDRYEGDFVNNKRNGKGILTWANGVRYEGDFVDDKLTGKGVCTWPNGTRYEGDWVDGNMNGYGTCYFPNGTIQRGQWSNGKFVQ